MTRQTVAILLILIFIIGLLPISVVSVTNNNRLPNYSISINSVDVKNMSSLYQKRPSAEFEEYIYLFDNYGDFYHFSSKIDPISKIYPNLLAIRSTKIVPRDRGMYHSFYPSHLFDEIQILQQPKKVSNDGSELDTVGLRGLYEKGYKGKNVTIGVLDNGIDFSHNLLEGKKAGSYFAGYDGVDPCYSHGTPVAGLISADAKDEFQGMAPFSKLYDIQFSCKGGSIEGDFLSAFNEVIKLNDTLDIINTSFGGFAATWDPIIQRVVDSGIIVVGSAGNSGPSMHSTTTGGPGNSIHGVSVGSLSENDEIATFSSHGPAFELTYKPDILAPGLNVLSTNDEGSLSKYSGTSFSSPMIAGGIAVLIEALQVNNITYNPGLIKSSILETAHSLGEDVLAEGRGIANFTRAFELIQSIGGTSPNLVSLRPTTGYIEYLGYIPRGMVVEFPISLITSNPENTSISFGSDFQGKEIGISPITDYSQNLGLTIDTTQFEVGKEVSGEIIASVDDISRKINLNFTIGGESRGVIGIDRVHTYWDQYGANHLGGSNIGEMVQLAMHQNYSIVEIESQLTKSGLEGIDILWMPDPLNLLHTTFDPLSELNFEEQPLYDNEMELLDEFIQDGKSVFITSLGSRYSQNLGKSHPFGLNATGLNSWISRYGIEAFTSPVLEQSQPFLIQSLNHSSLMKDVNRITHLGNYLKTTSGAWPLTGNPDKTTIALFQDPNSLGSLVVTSTNYWTDNRALSSGYFTDSNDRNLAINLWNWLGSSSHLVKLDQDINGDMLSGKFKIGGDLDNSKLKLLKSVNHEPPVSLAYDKNNGVYSFSTKILKEGLSVVQASIDDEYVGWSVLRDITGPTLLLDKDNPNNTAYEPSSFIIAKFQYSDDYSGVNKTSVKFELDESEISPVYNFDDFSSTLQVVIKASPLEENKYHQLKVEIKDHSGNPSSIVYQFSIGEVRTSSSVNTSTSTSNGLLRSKFQTGLFVIFIILINRRLYKFKINKD